MSTDIVTVTDQDFQRQVYRLREGTVEAPSQLSSSTAWLRPPARRPQAR